MKILLTGKKWSGGLGCSAPVHARDVVAVDYFDKELCGDLTNLDGIAQTVRTVRPDVNAAAHTAADKAESERASDPLNDKGARCWRRSRRLKCP
ncbi:sugar nucleotide-binding protein [Klebsiella pneumoniae]